MATPETAVPVELQHRRRPATVLVCRGCCCGTDRKHPDVDHEQQLQRWRDAAARGGARRARDRPCRLGGAFVTGIGPVGPLGGGSADRARSAQVRRWARSAFGLGDDDVVLVTELRCHEPGCPPVETVVAILGADAFERVEHRLHLSLAEVAPAHLWQLAAGDHGCCR